MSTITNKIYQFFKRHEHDDVIVAPNNVVAKFELTFKNVLIGSLTLDNGQWHFGYSEVFKNQTKIQPIVDFPDVQKVYDSDTLFPFFAFRIPSQQRMKIQQLITPDNAQDEILLLKQFGQQSIANPYRLIPSF